jgi:hypothetical protein
VYPATISCRPAPEARELAWAIQAAPGTRMVVYAPSDDATRRAMEPLVAAGSPQPRFPCWPAHQARALVPQPV